MAKRVGIKTEVLNDLASRFLINIPEEDKDDPVKLVSHIETAYWFYLDLQRPEDPSLPACSMKEFMSALFKHCPFLVRESTARGIDKLIAQWKTHKYSKPLRGGIILNQDLTKCVLVQGYPAHTSWGFPKGKLEQGENDMDAAVREVYEETGFDSRTLIRPKYFLEATVNGNNARMYIIAGVPETTEFAPRVRKEIADIKWFRIEDLPRHRDDMTPKHNLGKNPNHFFMVIPFIGALKRWISAHGKLVRQSKAGAEKPAQRSSRGISASFQPLSEHKGSGQSLHSTTKANVNLPTTCVPIQSGPGMGQQYAVAGMGPRQQDEGRGLPPNSQAQLQPETLPLHFSPFPTSTVQGHQPFHPVPSGYPVPSSYSMPMSTSHSVPANYPNAAHFIPSHPSTNTHPHTHTHSLLTPKALRLEPSRSFVDFRFSKELMFASNTILGLSS